MYLWTVQRKEIIKILIKTGEYYPDIKKSKGYSEMKLVYPLLLESFNSLNNNSFMGMIFGFYRENGKEPFKVIEDLYNYLYKHQDVSEAFNFWNSDSAILQIKVDNFINIMPIDFNDVIMLNIGKTKDLEKINDLNLSIDEFNSKLWSIINYMNKGITNPEPFLKSFIEGHYPYLKIKNILGIYPNFDLETSKNEKKIRLFNLSDDSKKLHELICKY